MFSGLRKRAAARKFAAAALVCAAGFCVSPANAQTCIGSPQTGGGSLSFSDIPDAAQAKVFYRLLISE